MSSSGRLLLWNNPEPSRLHREQARSHIEMHSNVGASLLAIGRYTALILKFCLKVNRFLTGLSFIPRC